MDKVAIIGCAIILLAGLIAIYPKKHKPFGWYDNQEKEE